MSITHLDIILLDFVLAIDISCLGFRAFVGCMVSRTFMTGHLSCAVLCDMVISAAFIASFDIKVFKY